MATATPATGKGRGGWLRLLLAVAGGAAIGVLFLQFSTSTDFRESFRNIDWGLTFWLLPLAALDHGLRFVRWQILVRRVAPGRYRTGRSLVAYLAGALLIFTPMRVGESAKSFYAQRLLGARWDKTLPVLGAERLADGIVMASLAALGFLLLGGQQPGSSFLPGLALLALLALAAGLGLIVRTFPRSFAERLRLRPLMVAASSLGTPSAAGMNLAIGTACWLIEVLIYFLAAAAVTGRFDVVLAVGALAVFPLASLLGAVSLLPGGIGVTEGGLAALGVTQLGLSLESAIAIAVLSRAAILGTVIVPGLPATLVALLARPAEGERTAGGGRP